LSYRIDEDHPAIGAVLSNAGAFLPELRAMIRVIEETVPVQRIWLDTAEARETPRTGFTSSHPEDVVQVLRVIYRNLVGRKGISPALARAQLLSSEPFNLYPDFVAALPDDPSREE
jgi:hypothetical protein